MNENLQIIFGLLGGLALFLFGMNMMSECLQKAAGEKMKSILSLLTRNPVMGVLAGALTTAVLQSSSATTVMARGFVSAGLMTLRQGISIIMGANIGTTITAQIIAFQISDYIYIIIFIGFIFSLLYKSEQKKNIWQTVFAFGLLFLGIDTMGNVMSPLAESPVFVHMIERVADIPVLGVAVGTIMTLVVQSSSATIAVLQNFASQAGPDGVTSILGLTGAIPILLGDNVGTTITAVLASLTQSRDAKRTAAAHCLFNISGCFLFIWFVKPYAHFIQWISPSGPEVEVISRQIANAHTTFNIIMTLIWLPLISVLVKIVMRVIPDKKGAPLPAGSSLHIDGKIISQPAAALQLLAGEVIRCSRVTEEMLKDVISAVQNDDKGQLAVISDKSVQVHDMYEKISGYLAELFSAGVLTEAQASRTVRLMYVLNDLDRLATLCAEFARHIWDKKEKKYQYSKEAMAEVEESLGIIKNMFDDVMDVFRNENIDENMAKKIRREKERVLELDSSMRKAHLKRVKDGTCKASLTKPFTRILNSIDRMGNSCMNLADVALDDTKFSYFYSFDEKGFDEKKNVAAEEAGV